MKSKNKKNIEISDRNHLNYADIFKPHCRQCGRSDCGLLASSIRGLNTWFEAVRACYVARVGAV